MGVFRNIAFVMMLNFLFICTSGAQNFRFDAQSRSEYIKAVNVYSLEDVRSVIQGVWSHGLNPKAYWTDAMEKTYLSRPTSTSLRKQANENFVRLLQDISTGSLDPENLSPDIRIKNKGFLSAKQFQALVISTGEQASVILESIAPQNPPYLALKAGLARLYPACKNGTWASLPKTKKVLKLGVRDPIVPELKRRFQLLGYPISSSDDLVDESVVSAINDIEWNLHMTPDGTIHPGGKLMKFFNVSCMARVHQIQADMEKMRWFPQHFEERFILINLAFTYFVMIDRSEGRNIVTSFRTINGRAERKSPTMKDQIVRVILNPYWVVPPTIFMEDKVTEIRGLPRWQIRDYFEDRNYEIWNHNFTKRLDPQSINWWSLDPDLDEKIYIRQKPHYWNALGVVKFDLTNSFSIYLHDTNQRELFTDPLRLLSSGCIRLERPLDLAEYLLQGTTWDRATIEASVAKPGEVMKRDTPIRLKNPMPVYTVFLTSQLTSDNILRFTNDIYNQNEVILANFKAAL